jgi:ribosome-associated translation inhibitor RaiA
MRKALPASQVRVSLYESLPESTADYVRRKISVVTGLTSKPVLSAKVRLTRYGNPSVREFVRAQANLDVDGQPVSARVVATTAQEAVDLLEAKLRRQLERTARHWEARRGHRPSPDAGQWKHGTPRAQRPPYFPRPAEDRQIIPRSSFALAEYSCDEAADAMDAMDDEFHLFTEAASGQDSVLYRAGQTGYRLAQVVPKPDEVSIGAVSVTVSGQPAPRLTVDEAVDRLELTGLPFVFFVDTDHARGRVLYRRYDGHYGLITPARV